MKRKRRQDLRSHSRECSEIFDLVASISFSWHRLLRRTIQRPVILLSFFVNSEQSIVNQGIRYSPFTIDHSPYSIRQFQMQ
jgi:hypothetical protein